MRGLFVAASVLTIGAGTSASADVIQLSLLDIGAFSEYRVYDPLPPLSGTGYIGVYSGSPSFAHLFTAEGRSSKTVAQVDLSGFMGATIERAYLSYSFLSQNLTPSAGLFITGSQGDGNLEYRFSAPTVNYGRVSGTTLRDNVADILPLVVAAANSSSGWLDLFIETALDVSSNYTFTYQPDGSIDRDAAKVRLTIQYMPAAAPPVPEPSTWAMMVTGFGVIGVALRRRVTSKLHLE